MYRPAEMTPRPEKPPSSNDELSNSSESMGSPVQQWLINLLIINTKSTRLVRKLKLEPEQSLVPEAIGHILRLDDLVCIVNF